jgi:hypothetical protein
MAAEVVVLKLYGDESSDEKRERVFAVAGVVGSEPEWRRAELSWIARTEGKPFHANHCEYEFAKDPDRAKHEANLKLYASLAQVLVESDLVGFAYALDLRAFGELFPEVLPDLAYHKCLTDLLTAAFTTARRFNDDPSEDVDVRLEFTFDARRESDGKTGEIYRVLRSQPEWMDAGILPEKIAFKDEPEPRLEMADLFAREAMKELDRQWTGKPPRPRRSYLALENSRKGTVKPFHFRERDRRYVEAWHDSVEQPEAKAMMESYRAWLAATGRTQNERPHDNLVNRILFFGQEQLAGK